MLHNDLLLAATESEPHTWAGANPYVVAIVTLAILLGLLAALMAFGAGREHS